MSIIFGNKIWVHQEGKKIPQRQLAAALEINTETFCMKIGRRAKRGQITVLSDLIEVD